MKRFTLAAAAAGLLMGACFLSVGCGQASTEVDRMAGSEGKMSAMEEGHMADGAMSAGKMDGGKMDDGKMSSK